ncbi:MAG TPA: 50S ribosomal protein L11 methyltransferase [Rhizobiales bacterium]|nr:ribosomal protein L11 methyltransferase [bacterium BMS3Bbin10]HDO52050.1 50S ribosomal protein L11 methyltransferase [Hyphomicrobiales bacterium]
MPDKTAHKAVLSLPRGAAEMLAASLSELYWPPADAVGLFDNEDGSWRVEATFSGNLDETAFRDFLDRQGVRDACVSFEEIPDADWVAMSQAGLHPVRAGRFFIHGSHDRAKAQGNPHAIEIDAAQAFGTAHHGSTKGCLMAIDDLAAREDMKNVLDIGTGTGILAIAAARVWRARVIASDSDPVAAGIANENFRRNEVQDRVECVTASGLAHPLIGAAAPFELVIANILATPVMDMAHDIAGALRPGGVAVLSGITNEQAERVTAAYRTVGFTRLRQFAVSEWVTLTLRAD